jgi:hypothetical protein
MGYPKDFKIPVSDTQAYKQFGNSVVVPVVERIAKAVLATLRRPADYRPELVLAMNDRASLDAVKRTAVQVSYRKAKARGKATANK